MAGVRRLIRAILRRRQADAPAPDSVRPAPVAAPIPVLEGFVEVQGIDLPAVGEAIEVVVGETVLAIANADGTFHAITGICPHAGGPLGDGHVEGMVLWCPFHNWNFHLETGIASVGGKKRVDVYEVRVDSGRLFVRLS